MALIYKESVFVLVRNKDCDKTTIAFYYEVHNFWNISMFISMNETENLFSLPQPSLCGNLVQKSTRYGRPNISKFAEVTERIYEISRCLVNILLVPTSPNLLISKKFLSFMSEITIRAS